MSPKPKKKRPGLRTGRGHRREPDALSARIGARIRAIRVELSVSFDELVEQTGLGRGYISEVERGLVVPTVGTLARIAAVLRVSVADLVLGDSERERIFADLRSAPATLLREVRGLLERPKKKKSRASR